MEIDNVLQKSVNNLDGVLVKQEFRENKVVCPNHIILMKPGHNINAQINVNVTERDNVLQKQVKQMDGVLEMLEQKKKNYYNLNKIVSQNHIILMKLRHNINVMVIVNVMERDNVLQKLVNNLDGVSVLLEQKKKNYLFNQNLL